MAKVNNPSSVWMAGQFREDHRIYAYQEDIYLFDPAKGVYACTERAWLLHAVAGFLSRTLGDDSFEARYVEDVAQSARRAAFLPGGGHVPFWTASGLPADVIVASNGVVRLEPLIAGGAPALDPFTSDLLAVSGVAYPYDPAAGCPRWLDFLGWMCGGDAGEVELVRQFTAWVFVARWLRLEKLLWLCGPGGNGKSTAMRVLRHVVGEGATSAVGLEAFSGGDNFRLWAVLHKKANFCNDANVKRKANVAALNAFVSGDPHTVNRKHRDHVTVEPTTVCFFASNDAPQLPDDSDAWWRRVLVVRCDQRPAEGRADPHLFEALKAEAPGVLNWALAAVPALLRRGHLDVPESVRRNVEGLKAQVNPARMFIAERVGRSDPGAFLPRERFMSDFESWCRDNGFKPGDLSQASGEMRRAFGAELTRVRRGDMSALGRARVRGWAGVGWRDDEGPDELDFVREGAAARPAPPVPPGDAERRQLQEDLGVFRSLFDKQEALLVSRAAEVAALTEELRRRLGPAAADAGTPVPRPGGGTDGLARPPEALQDGDGDGVAPGKGA